MSYEICTVAIGSQTMAIKAQRLLAQAAIRASIVKPDAAREGHGCVWGLEIPCVQRNNVHTILKNARIPVHDGSGGGGRI